MRQGVPFREAHEVAGGCVRRAEARGVELWDLSDDELRSISDHLTPAVRDVLTVRGALDARSAFGGTAPARVREQLDRRDRRRRRRRRLGRVPTRGLSRGPVARGRVLARSFYDRPSPEVARDLLGAVVESETPEGVVGVRLVEVEAYAGEDDPASHAWRGRTPRTAVMFGPPGRRVRVLHLRHALVPQRGVPGRGPRLRRAAARR